MQHACAAVLPCCQQIWHIFNCANAYKSSSVMLVEILGSFSRGRGTWVFLSFNSISGQARNMQGPCCIEDLWVRSCNFSWALQIKLECFTVRNCILIISSDFAASIIRLIHEFVFRCLPYEFSKPTCSEFITVRHPQLLIKIGVPISCMFSVIDLSPHIYKGQRSHTTNKIVIVEIQPKTFTCFKALIFQHVSGCINNPLQNLEPKVGAVICQRKEKKIFQVTQANLLH